MRGRAHYISKRYSKVSNKYLKSYVPKQESKYIIYTYLFNYINVKNLYGLAMSKFFQQADSNG